MPMDLGQGSGMARTLLPNEIRTWRKRAGLSQAQLADKIKVSVGQIIKLEKGERRLTQDWMVKIAPALNCRPADLLLASPEDFKLTRHREDLESSEVIDLGGEKAVNFAGMTYWPIGVFDVRVSAGAGSLNAEKPLPVYYQFFTGAMLERLTSASPLNLAVVRVSGDSMWDTLHDGDHVLVDRTIQAVGREGIYVLTAPFGGETIVKRCQRSMKTRLLTLISDNPKYPAEGDIPDDAINVFGRVIWLGRNIGR